MKEKKLKSKNGKLPVVKNEKSMISVPVKTPVVPKGYEISGVEFILKKVTTGKTISPAIKKVTPVVKKTAPKVATKVATKKIDKKVVAKKVITNKAVAPKKVVNK